jgi:uncharacterized membrane protein
MSALWGLGLGLADSLFFVLARKAYDIYIQSNKLNSMLTAVDIWQYVFLGSLIGVLTPIAYLWAAYNVTGLIDIHLYRCVISAFFAILYSHYAFDDTINGYKLIGAGLSAIGLLFVIFSTMYKS